MNYFSDLRLHFCNCLNYQKNILLWYLYGIKMYVVFKKSINFKNDSDTNSEQFFNFFLLLNCNDS